MLMRRIAIPCERLQTAAIPGHESNGNSSSHAPDSQASSPAGIPVGIQMSDLIHCLKRSISLLAREPRACSARTLDAPRVVSRRPRAAASRPAVTPSTRRLNPPKGYITGAIIIEPCRTSSPADATDVRSSPLGAGDYADDHKIAWHYIAPGKRCKTPSSKASTAVCAMSS
jgi:hypothetical protein